MKINLLKTFVFVFVKVIFISTTNAVPLLNKNNDFIENDLIKSDIPPDWVDIGLGKFNGEFTPRDCIYGTWFDYSLGIFWAYVITIPMTPLSIYRKIHILPKGKISWECNSVEDVGGDIKINNVAYKQFWLTGFRGNFLKLSGGVFDADIYIQSLKVNGYANHVYIPLT